MSGNAIGAHLMRLENRPNAFLGRSTFEREGDESLAWGEGHVFLIGPGGIEIYGGQPEAQAANTRLGRLYRGLGALHALEIKGRIWNGQRHGQPPEN